MGANTGTAGVLDGPGECPVGDTVAGTTDVHRRSGPANAAAAPPKRRGDNGEDAASRVSTLHRRFTWPNGKLSRLATFIIFKYYLVFNRLKNILFQKSKYTNWQDGRDSNPQPRA